MYTSPATLHRGTRNQSARIFVHSCSTSKRLTLKWVSAVHGGCRITQHTIFSLHNQFYACCALGEFVLLIKRHYSHGE